MSNKNVSPAHNGSEDEADLFCPALPPHLLKNSSEPIHSTIKGPTLPLNYKPDAHVTEKIVSSPKSDSEDDDHIIGPLPDNVGQDTRFNVPEMEYRMENMIKKASEKADNKLKRETWMLELPSDKPNILALGLEPRQFRKKIVELGDRSVWTDTPEDKERKKKQRKASPEPSIDDLASRKRDEELKQIIKTFQEKERSVPLIESHKEKKKSDSKPMERRPFSREDDLQVNKFDEAQKETILKKARNLNDRFSSGKRKFL